MRTTNRKFRLRLDSRVVGYAEETPKGMLFKGKDALWWMQGKPNYNQVDEAIDIKDNLHRDIYELDIVAYRINDNKPYRKGVVLWEQKQKKFGLYDIESKHFTHFFIEDLCLFKSDAVEIISHLFNHPKLEQELGLSDI